MPLIFSIPIVGLIHCEGCNQLGLGSSHLSAQERFVFFVVLCSNRLAAQGRGGQHFA